MPRFYTGIWERCGVESRSGVRRLGSGGFVVPSRTGGAKLHLTQDQVELTPLQVEFQVEFFKRIHLCKMSLTC